MITISTSYALTKKLIQTLGEKFQMSSGPYGPIFFFAFDDIYRVPKYFTIIKKIEGALCWRLSNFINLVICKNVTVYKRTQFIIEMFIIPFYST